MRHPLHFSSAKNELQTPRVQLRRETCWEVGAYMETYRVCWVDAVQIMRALHGKIAFMQTCFWRIGFAAFVSLIEESMKWMKSCSPFNGDSCAGFE